MMQTANILFGAGKAVVTNSDVCVLKGLVGMLVHRVYRTTVANKKILAQVLQGRFH